ncbi:uncharacterized protein LOC129753919 [Uranotaenia lowii]|uniref:uncharacterized protein LOC129753919 n=1 Tax=Uranotaenia lowii TaxID=190385 RepID=UPI002478BE23|nr:uncharacterized protein LOC129753919 [Uranotaenia lowii]
MDYDNGVANAPSSESRNEKPKRSKNTKKSLSKELESEKAKTNDLMERLLKLEEENKALRSFRQNSQQTDDEASSVEFSKEPGASSTHRAEILPAGIMQSSTAAGIMQSATAAVQEETRFASSINQLALSTIAVPECKPLAEGEEIDRQTFDMWLEMLNNCMDLAGISDELTQFTVLKVKSGPRLLQIYKNTRSDENAPDPSLQPYSNAVHRMKAYFGSISDVMLQRRKLSAMIQKPEESDLSFINRVASTARLCDFDGNKEFDEIIRAVAEHATFKQVRVAALKIQNRGGTYTQLIDKVREIQSIRLNEEIFAASHRNTEPAVLAPVRAGPSMEHRRNFDFGRQRMNNRQFQNNRAKPYYVGYKYNEERVKPREQYQPFNNQRPKQTGSIPNRRFQPYDGQRWRTNKPLSRPKFETNYNSHENLRCGKCNSPFHDADKCPNADSVCYNCDKKGHIQRACPFPIRNRFRNRQVPGTLEAKVNEVAIDDGESEMEKPNVQVSICQRNIDGMDPLVLATIGILADDGIVSAQVAGLSCDFLVDSGAQVNTFTDDLFTILKADEQYCKEMVNLKIGTDRPLTAYATKDQIDVIATFEAPLFISSDRPFLLEKFYVVREAKSLLGRATALRYSVLMLGLKVPIPKQAIDVKHHHLKGYVASIAKVDLFPKFNIPPVKISYDDTNAPCRNIFTNIPHALKPLVEERLKHLVASGIIEPVTEGMDTQFCSSMLVIPKGKEDIRLVIDLRGPNRYIHRTPFSMPTMDSILSDLKGANLFSTIDLSNAYFHVELHESSRHLTNFFTEFGMYRYVRLPFGLCNAPDLFQEILQRQILGGCEGFRNYLDDLIIYGRTKEEHDIRLSAILARLKQHNVKLNTSKCVFGSTAVIFLGFKLTSNGWQVSDEKMNAIQNFRRPNSFYWTDNEEQEFKYLRDKALKTIKTLGYYSSTDRTELYVDASPFGLGAVLVQFDQSDLPRVIGCASKALTATEQNYPHTQKEALAIVWGVERFRFYLLGRSFVIRSDAEANEYIFNANHRLGKRAVTRAETWALRLQPFDFVVKRVAGNENIADSLSRLIEGSQTAIPFEENDEPHLLYSIDVEIMQMTWEEVEKASEADEEIQTVHKALRTNNWPKELRKFQAQKKTLYALGFLLFKGDRAVLPQELRHKALTYAHGGHVGETAMKRIMREFFWWPGMSLDTVRFVKECETCTVLSKKNRPLPLSPREMPEGPWQILQIDFLAVPGCGSGEFLVAVDTHSRFLSVVEMKHTDAANTNAALSEIFKLWGCPLILQSDNGPPFQGSSFVEFWEARGVRRGRTRA